MHRVSNESQADSGLGLAAQTALIRDAFARLAKKHKLEIGKIFRDPAVSATRLALFARPGGFELNHTLLPGDHVVIAKLDRAFRSQRDCVITCETWMARGITVHMLDIGVDTNTPLGRMLIGILSTIAQWESARIGERIRDACKAARDAGRSSNGQPVIGYRLMRGNRLVPCQKQRRLARSMASMRERKTLREIAAFYNAKKIKRPNGKAWNNQAVWRMVEAAKHNFP